MQKKIFLIWSAFDNKASYAKNVSELNFLTCNCMYFYFGLVVLPRSLDHGSFYPNIKCIFNLKSKH